jgi:hypothetical protein
LGYTDKGDEHIKGQIYGEGNVLGDINDLIGFTLGDALKIAAENGYRIGDISITAPPKLDISEYDNSFRILRVQSQGDKTLTILVCKPL